ncbi:MAG: hypothetical protein HKN85_08440 [Gammaproteobacteria bacterium]|nr:hypothetical protein [Gammaproteobacteria bacterium]
MNNMQLISTSFPLKARRIPACMSRVVWLATLLFTATTSHAQDTLSPPEIGEETKGTPAVAERSVDGAKKQVSATGKEQPKSTNASIFGTAKVTESRRESGQVYLIELEHSSGSKQYIEENDSDGKIESTSNDIEETPNLPKWKIGSW